MNTSPYVVYLLHFDQEVEGQSHYLGCTKRERLTLRMHEHRIGRGAKLTKKAVAQGARLVLVRAIPADGFEEERRHRLRGHYRQLCPICEPGLCKAEIKSILLPARRTPARAWWPRWTGFGKIDRGPP